jgi:dihydroneopterin aldolase
MKVRSMRILVEAVEVQVDIGFHEFEVGAPQRLLVTVECWLDQVAAPDDDHTAGAWDYDLVKSEVERIAASRRFNLQETFAHQLFASLAPLHGLQALRIRTSKPDVYANAAGVGVEIASFAGQWPESRVSRLPDVEQNSLHGL